MQKSQLESRKHGHIQLPSGDKDVTAWQDLQLPPVYAKSGSGVKGVDVKDTLRVSEIMREGWCNSAVIGCQRCKSLMILLQALPTASRRNKQKAITSVLALQERL